MTPFDKNFQEAMEKMLPHFSPEREDGGAPFVVLVFDNATGCINTASNMEQRDVRRLVEDFLRTPDALVATTVDGKFVHNETGVSQ